MVCPEVAYRYSSEKQLVYLDELVLYMIHGLLHLCGYDDIDPQDRKVMRKKERYHMDYLRLLKLI
jgi:probable rRNA maturation factor